MAVQGVSPEQAFSDMSRQSQNSNVKLRDIAGRIVARASRHPE